MPIIRSFIVRGKEPLEPASIFKVLVGGSYAIPAKTGVAAGKVTPNAKINDKKINNSLLIPVLLIVLFSIY
ncbi:hypothetical protein ACFLY3_04150 [Chloroflexota bacterium]